MAALVPSKVPGGTESFPTLLTLKGLVFSQGLLRDLTVPIVFITLLSLIQSLECVSTFIVLKRRKRTRGGPKFHAIHFPSIFLIVIGFMLCIRLKEHTQR